MLTLLIIAIALLPIYLMSRRKPTTQPTSLGRNYLIDYRDDNGHITQRQITLQRISKNNNKTYLNAFCHIRKEQRSFRLDRIIGDIIDLDTGELIKPHTLIPRNNRH